MEFDSTIAYRVLPDQQKHSVARAAKEAGVELFPPSDYGGEAMHSFWRGDGFVSIWKKSHSSPLAGGSGYFRAILDIYSLLVANPHF